MNEPPESGSAEELAALFPAAHEVQVHEPMDPTAPTKGRAMTTVIVRPLNAIEAAQLVVKMKPLLEAYDPAKPALQLITEHMAIVVDVAAVATDRSGEWLMRLDAGDCLDVMVHVIEANENFLRRVADLVAGPTGRRLAMLFSSVGPTPSPSSQGTASPPRKPLSSFRARSTQ